MQTIKKQEISYQALFYRQPNIVAIQKIIYNEVGEPVDFIYVDGNEQLEKLLGKKRQDFLNKKVSELIPGFEKNYVELIHTYSKVAETGSPIDLEYYFESIDTWFNIKVFSPQKDYFATIIEDITDVKAVINDIENARKLADTLTDTSPFGIILYNESGDCIMANQLAAKLVGGTKRELLKQNYHRIKSWKTGNMYKDALVTIETGKKKLNTEKIKTTFGKTLWIEYYFVRMMYDKKPHLILKFHDVTDRIKEQQLLKESENRYKNLFYDNKSVMLLIEPESGQIVDANNAAINFYGYTLAQLKKMNISEINTLSQHEIREEMEKAVKNKKRYFQFKHKLANGKLRDVQVYSGKVVFFEKELLYSIIHDNTNEIKAVQKSKRQTADLIQSEKMNAMGTLIAGVSHELNNPLMGILNYTDYCLKHVPESNKAHHVLKDLKEEAEKSAEIVKGLLTFSRKGNADNSISQKTDLIVAVKAVIKILSLKMKNKNINIHLPKTSEKVIGNINLSYLQQVIFNVLDNAIYAVDNTDKKEIKIDIKRQVKYNVIQISDSGIGISIKQNSNVFDPFFTTKPVGEGTGLGLSICKNILNDIGGDISFNSKPGKGTTFFIKIPVSNENEQKR